MERGEAADLRWQHQVRGLQISRLILDRRRQWSRRLFMRLDLSLLLIQLPLDGVKGVTQGHMGIFIFFMLGRWFPVDDKFPFRAGDVDTGLEQTALVVMGGRGLNNDVATDDIPMVAGQLVNMFTDIRFDDFGCLHITKGDL
jgi:hypothetical protein